MENKNTADRKTELPCESAPFLEKIAMDFWDKVFAAMYFLLGYALWKVFDYTLPFLSWTRGFQIKAACFTVLYMGVVLAYCKVKRLSVTREKIFWTLILLGIGAPLAFYTVMPFVQILALLVTAAYWTLAVTDGLVKEKKTSSWVLLDLWHSLCSLPVLHFFCQLRILCTSLCGKKRRKEGGMVLLGILLSVPVLCMILPILSRADEGFELILKSIGSQFTTAWSFELLPGIFMTLLFSALMYGLAYGGLYKTYIDVSFCENWKEKSGQGFHIIPDTAMYTFAGIVCLTYLLFIGLQGRYLFSAFLGILPDSFTYAEYARRGFFELCIIAALNGVLVLGMNRFSRTIMRENQKLRIINVLFSVLTILLLATAASKMGMYIAAYGFTVKRLLTSVFMLWLLAVFAMIIYIQRKEIPLVRWAVFLGAVLFTLLCILPVETLLKHANAAF